MANTNNTENLTVGTLVTICIGSDRYAGKVVKSTRRTCVVEYLYGGMKGDTRTFRLTTADAAYYTYRVHHYLTLGEARQEMDPSF